MPLSEHEQRMLDEIERALYEDDPKFATSVNVSRIRRRRPIVAGCLFVAGLVALVVGVIATQSFLAVGVVVSVIGFLTMVAAVGLFVFGQPGQRGPPRASRRAHEVLTLAGQSDGRALPPALRRARPVAALPSRPLLPRPG